MKIKLWTHEWKDDEGFPKVLKVYESSIIPEIGSWIALGTGSSYPTWKVAKVIHIIERDEVSIQLTY